MITLNLTNRRVLIIGAKRKQIRSLEAATSYRVEGARFSQAFRKGWWDGKEHLLTYSAKHGYNAPIGLHEDIARALDDLGVPYTVEDNRMIHGARRTLRWNPDVKPRDYQREATAGILNKLVGQTGFGSGLLRMPIRSGKTKTAAMYIRALGLRTVFVVPSQMLLYQTHKSLRECFPDESIGLVGDGECDIQFITVITIQTLQRWRKAKDKRYAELKDNVDVVVVDEAHHLRGESEWHKVIGDFDARFRVALSATAYLDSEVEQGRGIIWLKGCVGPSRVDISESRLIRAGYLMAQKVMMMTVRAPAKLESWKWSTLLQREGVWNNKHRNAIMVKAAKALSDEGNKVLIVSNRLEHIDVLTQELWDADVKHEVVTGRDNRTARQEKVEEFLSGGVNVLLGTVFAEGVDIPEVEVVINAEGGRDAKATMQRMRNMTVADGKNRALLIDFMDEFNPYLHKHSAERLKVYQSIPEFNVEVVG